MQESRDCLEVTPAEPQAMEPETHDYNWNETNKLSTDIIWLNLSSLERFSYYKTLFLNFIWNM